MIKKKVKLMLAKQGLVIQDKDSEVPLPDPELKNLMSAIQNRLKPIEASVLSKGSATQSIVPKLQT